MKRSVLRSVIVLATVCFAACSDNTVLNPDSVQQIRGNTLQRQQPPPPSNANPAIAFIRNYTVFHQGSYTFSVPAVWVMDANGANATMLYANYVFNGRNGQNSSHTPSWPTWSPNGQKICFHLDAYDLYTMDVAVVNGVPVASNVVKLLDGAAYGGHFYKGVWSPVTSEIATVFSQSSSPTKIQTVPSGGGAPSTIYTSASTDFWIGASLSYNPDGSKIAFSEQQISTGYNWLKIVDRASGSVTTSIGMNQFYALGQVDWARTPGGSTIAFDAGANSSSSRDSVYTVDASSSSTPTFRIKGRNPTWSPDDGKFAYMDLTQNFSTGDGIRTLTLSGGAVATLTTFADASPDWKR